MASTFEVVTWKDGVAAKEKVAKEFSEFLYDNDSNGGILNKLDETKKTIDDIISDVKDIEEKYKALQNIYNKFTDYNSIMDMNARKMMSLAESIEKTYNQMLDNMVSSLEEHLKEDDSLMEDLRVLSEHLGIEVEGVESSGGATSSSGSSGAAAVPPAVDTGSSGGSNSPATNESPTSVPSSTPSGDLTGFNGSGENNQSVVDELANFQSGLKPGKGSYKGMCGELVADQLVSKGLVEPGFGGVSGYATVDAIVNGTATLTPGTKVEHITFDKSVSQADQFKQMVNNHGGNMENVVFSFSRGVGSAHGTYGHTMMISKIENGRVYYIDNANWNGGHVVRADRGSHLTSMSIDDFVNSHYCKGYDISGIAVVSK